MVGRLAVIALLAFAPITVASAAHAHGEGETQEGYLLVQQALGYLADDSGPHGADLAMEKINDALETDDQEGVSVGELKQGMDALEAGQVDRARTLFEHSITAALADRPLATGYETGTGVVAAQLPGRGPLHRGDWLVLALSAGLSALGVWMAVRFRPHDTVGGLRILLGVTPATSGVTRRGWRKAGQRR